MKKRLIIVVPQVLCIIKSCLIFFSPVYFCEMRCTLGTILYFPLEVRLVVKLSLSNSFNLFLKRKKEKRKKKKREKIFSSVQMKNIV